MPWGKTISNFHYYSLFCFYLDGLRIPFCCGKKCSETCLFCYCLFLWLQGLWLGMLIAFFVQAMCLSVATICTNFEKEAGKAKEKRQKFNIHADSLESNNRAEDAYPILSREMSSLLVAYIYVARQENLMFSGSGTWKHGQDFSSELVPI
uniref:Uncharacterized protein n=1 Tax=Kalanchoe fedtschenkoi TaxID=63787 RepID=A0A7N0RE04_KALFE